MSEQLDFYCKQARLSQPEQAWLSGLQKQALDDFVRLGFPTKKNEEWKYTSIDSFFQHEFTSAPQVDRQSGQDTDLPIEHKIDIVNGVAVGISELLNRLPQGVVIAPLASALTDHQKLIKPYLGQILSHEHGFQALNTAMLHAGLVIYLPKGIQVEEPILLNHWQDIDGQAVHLRHVVIADQGSSATVIEHYQGQASQCYFTNVVTEIFAAKEAKVTHYKIQRESKAAYHIGHLAAKLKAHSEVNSHSISLGGRLVRSDITMDMSESYSKCLMNGIYAPGEGQHVDHHTLVEHRVPDCTSIQDYKGILSGKSRAVFNGKVKVAVDAQHTEAQQQNKNLILSPQAEVDTKPQLEIFADDVICSHGATVGQLDEQALFYLATRGIGRQQASQFLIQAFAAENLKLIDDIKLSEWMQLQLNQQLG